MSVLLRTVDIAMCLSISIQNFVQNTSGLKYGLNKGGIYPVRILGISVNSSNIQPIIIIVLGIYVLTFQCIMKCEVQYTLFVTYIFVQNKTIPKSVINIVVERIHAETLLVVLFSYSEIIHMIRPHM